MELREISWETIQFQWKFNLWPGRYEYKPMSSMVYNKREEYDMEIYEKYEPTFWGVFEKDLLIGVNSSFRTSDDMYRSRGIYVAKSHRKRGVAQMLFDALEEQAKKEGCKFLWSYPREGSHYAYLKFGFELTSDWQPDSFGRNAYVLKQIELPESIVD